MLQDTFYETLLDNLFDGVYFVDATRKITYWNKEAKSLTGYTSRETLGRKCCGHVLVHVDKSGTELCNVRCPLVQAMDTGKPYEADIFLLHKDGHRLPVTVRTTPIRDKDDVIVGAMELFHDCSERLSAMHRIEDLEKLALRCPLTGVANRAYSQDSLENALDEYRRYGASFGVVFIDIDYFKSVNDIHGHETGDLVLKAVASTIMKSLRSFDFVGRWGGDEFIVIAPHVDRRALGEIVERLWALIGSAAVMVGGRRLPVTVSIGAAVARVEDTPEILIDRADRLMYRSKAAGRNRVTLDG
jgi:diguanylate cyclase (GGDEF)-like protein/PAS domain S-box-containing protein